MTSGGKRHGGTTGAGRTRPPSGAAAMPQPKPASAGPAGDVAAHLEELAEDMVGLLRRMQSLDESLSATAARSERIESRMEELAVSNGRALDALRRDTVGERRHLAAVGVLDAMIPWMDALAGHARRCDEDGSAETAQQIHTTLELLSAMLRTLGFVALEIRVGDPFDPRCMQSVAYADGKPGTVVDIVGPGYTSDDAVVRPARVLVPDPQAPVAEPEPELQDVIVVKSHLAGESVSQVVPEIDIEVIRDVVATRADPEGPSNDPDAAAQSAPPHEEEAQ